MSLHYVDESLDEVNCRTNPINLQTESSIVRDNKNIIRFRHHTPLQDPVNLKDMKLDTQGLYIMANSQFWIEKQMRSIYIGYSHTISEKTLREHDKNTPLIVPFLISMAGYAHHTPQSTATMQLSFQKIGPCYYISDIIIDIPIDQYILCAETLKKMGVPLFPDIMLRDAKQC